MRKFFFILSISFGILLIVNIGWGLISLYLLVANGIQFLLQGMNFFESISSSIYLKWILVSDGIWLAFALTYMVQHKQYKTNPKFHYLKNQPIENPEICFVIPAYNEDESIQSVVSDYKKQPFVKQVIVIDNHSSDKTADIAEKCGAKVLRKDTNKGYAHSYIMGLKEALKTNANIIATTEADGTFNAYDVQKMLPYLDNCDMVIGTRLVQVLTEKGNQISIIHVWGNYFLAKLIQAKYFSLRHMGIIELTDVGCMLRFFRRSSLEKFIDFLTPFNSDEPIGGDAFALHLTMLGIENDLKIVEIPVTFNKRTGKSKNESEKKIKGVIYGLKFLWFILVY